MISSICGLWAESRPRVTAGTWSPMAWMKTYLVRRRRPSPKPRRSKPKSTSWKGGDDHGSWSRSLLKIVFRKKHIQWGIRLKCTYLIFGCETRDTDYFLPLYLLTPEASRPSWISSNFRDSEMQKKNEIHMLHRQYKYECFLLIFRVHTLTITYQPSKTT